MLQTNNENTMNITSKTVMGKTAFRPTTSRHFSFSHARQNNNLSVRNQAVRLLTEQIVSWGLNGSPEDMADMKEAFNLIDQTDFCVNTVINHKPQSNVWLNRCSNRVRQWYQVYVNCIYLPFGITFNFVNNEPYSYTDANNEKQEGTRSYIVFKNTRSHFNSTTNTKYEAKVEDKVEAKTEHIQ